MATRGAAGATIGWPMVGRHADLEDFAAVLTDRGRHAVVICGSVGVGKTRLGEECLALAAQRGHSVGRATASEAAASVPFGAVAHLLTGQLTGADGSTDPAAVFAAAGSGRRGRMAGAGQRRAVWLVDALHLIDATSMTLIGQLLDADLLVLLATVRDGEAIG